ncbi:MAG: EAL and HDOD domain-containing protein [Pseudomonadota bacterium]
MGEIMKHEYPPHAQETSSNYAIAIQPIVDIQLRHVADELLYRDNVSQGHASIVDDVQATARACAISVYEIGLDKLCGSRQLFINASSKWLTNPNLSGLPSDQIVIEILEDTEPTDEVINAIKQLKKYGYKLALDDFVLNDENHIFLPFCDIIKFDISNKIPENLVQKLASEGFTLLAERVETHEDFKYCKELGFTLFQGYFYERPQTQSSSSPRRSASRANQMQLLSCLYSDNINLPQISDLIARDPHLLNAIFKRANSARSGSHRIATKLIDCLHIIGLKELRTLVTILMLADNNPVSKLNLLKGLTRAFACEIAASQRQVDEQESFIAGLFSLMPTILGIKEELMKDEIKLGEKIENAIYQRRGTLGELIGDVEAAENQIYSSELTGETMLKAAAKARVLVYSEQY